MAKPSNNIHLNENKYHGLNIGGVIEKNLDQLKERKCNSMLLIVCNQHIYGSFVIPDAIGFSTPVELISDGYLSFYENINDSIPIIEKYNRWRMTYGTEPIKKDNIYKFTNDQQGCNICSKEYEIGDDIMELPNCKHKFHHDCLVKLRSKYNPTEWKKIIELLVYEKSVKFPCPICIKY